MRLRQRWSLGITLCLFGAACGSSSTSSSTSPAATTVADTSVVTTDRAPATSDAATSTTPSQRKSVLAYFLMNEKLRVVGRIVEIADPAAAIEALLAGPTSAEAAAGMVTLIPAGTELLSVTVTGREVRVDLTGVFASGGGSMSVLGRLAQMVFTLTQFEGIDTARFSLDGEPITEITGEGVGVDGVTRATFTDMAPLVLLEHPYHDETVAQPIRIAGRSNTFEATVYYEVLGADGVKLLEGYVMATAGTGEWGTFDARLADLPPGTKGPLQVRVFDRSAENGEPVSAAEVRINL